MQKCCNMFFSKKFKVLPLIVKSFEVVPKPVWRSWIKHALFCTTSLLLWDTLSQTEQRKAAPIYWLSSVGQESTWAGLGSVLGVSQGWDEGGGQAGLSWGFWGKTPFPAHSGCSQNALPHGCGIEGSVSSWIVNQGQSVLRGDACVTSHKWRGQVPLTLWIPVAFPLPPAREDSLLLWPSHHATGPTWVIQGKRTCHVNAALSWE